MNFKKFIDLKKFRPFFPILGIIVIFVLICLAIRIDENILMRLSPVILFLCLALIIIFAALGMGSIIKIFKSINRRTWIMLAVIVLVGFSIRMFLVPHSHRIFFDEDGYLNIAKNIAEQGKACVCYSGNATSCFDCIPDKEPSGMPVFYSIFFFLFGVSERLATGISVIIGALSILLVFFLAYLLFKKENLALCSSLVFAFIPVHIIWSVTQTADLFLAFLSLLTASLLLIYLETRKTSILYASFFALAYTCSIRPESLLFAFIAAAIFLILDKNFPDTLKNRHFLTAFMLFLLLILPTIEHTSNFIGDKWGASENKLGTEYFAGNMQNNSNFFIENIRFPITFMIFAVYGFILSLKKSAKQALFLLAWLLVFFGVYLFFYSGNFYHLVDERFTLNLYPSIAVFTGVGFVSFFSRFRKHKIIRISTIIIIISSLIPFASMITEYPQMNSIDAVRASHDFGINEAKSMKNCMIIAESSVIFLLHDIPSIMPENATDKETIDRLKQEYGCVMFYEDYWCVLVKEYRSGVCRQMKMDYNMSEYSKFDFQIKDRASKVHNLAFKFYKIE